MPIFNATHKQIDERMHRLEKIKYIKEIIVLCSMKEVQVLKKTSGGFLEALLYTHIQFLTAFNILHSHCYGSVYRIQVLLGYLIRRVSTDPDTISLTVKHTTTYVQKTTAAILENCICE